MLVLVFVILGSKCSINNGFTDPFWKTIPWNKMLNDTHREKLCFTQFIADGFTDIEAWLLLTFLICLHNQLNSLSSINILIAFCSSSAMIIFASKGLREVPILTASTC